MSKRPLTFIHAKTTPPSLETKDVLGLQHPSATNSSIVGNRTKIKDRLQRALIMEHYWML